MKMICRTASQLAHGRKVLGLGAAELTSMATQTTFFKTHSVCQSSLADYDMHLIKKESTVCSTCQLKSSIATDVYRWFQHRERAELRRRARPKALELRCVP